MKPDRTYLWAAYIFLAVLLLVYLLFPSHNNSGDAWSYAADARYGKDLFSPHHLLYTFAVYAAAHLAGTANTLAAGMVLNAVAGALCWFILYNILLQLHGHAPRALWLTAAVAFSFGFWRFTTENEAYILPIVFSLGASWFFIYAAIREKQGFGYVFISGVLAAVACLFHQIHIFWFGGLLLGWWLLPFGRRWLRAMAFACTFVLAPAAYLLVIKYCLGQPLNTYNVVHFVWHDYFTGAAGNRVGADNILLGVVNFGRTFLQVHGSGRVLIRHSIFWLLPGFAAAGMLFFGLVTVFTGRSKKTEAPFARDVILHTHIVIFILQLAFAIYNIGNAEFMVMLPALLAIIVIRFRRLPLLSIQMAALGLLVWNFSYGIYPNYGISFNADRKVTKFIIDHPNSKFIAREPAIILNQYYYEKGHWPENCWAGPGYYVLHKPLTDLTRRIDSCLKAGGTLYTDCEGRPEMMSRSGWHTDHDFFHYNYPHDTAAEYPVYGGKHVIFRINKWTDQH